MPVVSENQNRQPRRWLLAVGLTPVVLLLLAAGFLVWLPNQHRSLTVGNGSLTASWTPNVLGQPAGVSAYHVGPAGAVQHFDVLDVIVGPYIYELVWLQL
jgi:hypothetical protein